MTTNPNTPTTKESKRPIDTIRALFEKQKDELAKVLPKHLTLERMARVALTTINKNPKLLACTPHSLLACCMDCAALGLEPDGRRAHLIPFEDRKNKRTICTLIIDYKGLVELVMNTGEVSNIHADTVCDNDEFDYDRGEIKKHKIDFKKPRGNAYAAYAIIRMKDGTEKHEVMSRDAIYLVRDKSTGWKAFKAGYASQNPWADTQSEPEMWKKTVFRRSTKWVKLSPELKEKIEKDDDQFEEEFGATITMPKFEDESPKAAKLPDSPKPEPESEPETLEESSEAAPEKGALSQVEAPKEESKQAAPDFAEEEIKWEGEAEPEAKAEEAPVTVMPKYSPEIINLLEKLKVDKINEAHFHQWVIIRKFITNGQSLSDLSAERVETLTKNMKTIFKYIWSDLKKLGVEKPK